MIIVTTRHVADFASLFASNRISQHVFYEVRSPGGETRFETACFHFLGSMGALTVLFQVNLNVPSSGSLQDIVEEMRSMLHCDDGDVLLVDGTIREIYMSLS